MTTDVFTLIVLYQSQKNAATKVTAFLFFGLVSASPAILGCFLPDLFLAAYPAVHYKT
ncbi:hypothetical protein [Vibrio eleionomae]|uniref:hypothetical protein n=1 Tax=Vibrio eleionomae TaxID=2653505 RepID=UPI00136C469A|nr:hypothetical protein [Vibrio eleionomae]